MKIIRMLLTEVLLIILYITYSYPVFSQIDKRHITKTDTNEVLNHIDLFMTLRYSDTANARANLEKALAKSRNSGYLNGIASSTLYLGTYYLEQFDLTKAEHYFTESFEASKKSGNKTGEANSANNLGTIAEKKGDYSSAVLNYLYAYELFDSLKNIKGLSAATNNLGIVYYLLDETPKALRFLKRSLSLKQYLNDSAEMIYTYQNLGNVYFDTWNYDSATYFYQKCIDLSNTLNDPVSEGKAYNSLGVIAMLENNYQKSENLFAKAMQSSGMKNDIRNISAVYDNLGLLNMKAGMLQNAAAYFDSSLTLSKRYDLREEMKNSYQHLASLYAKQENFRDAFLNLQNYDNLQNSLLDEKGNVAGVEALFMKQKQENKILVLEKEQEKRKTQIIVLVAIIFIISLVTIFGFLIYRISQNSKHAKKLAELERDRFKAVIEAQELERKRIAGDLHDSVGQMLSLSKLQLSEIMDFEAGLASAQKQIIDRTAKIIDDTCQEVRNISHNLMPGSLIRLGLEAVGKDIVRKINSSNKIQASFISNLNGARFDEKIEISDFRIIQEILNNILKHAKASKIDIILNRHFDEKLELSIADNGTGFDVRDIEKSNGIGWKNIYSRLSIINGTMNVNSIKSSGTIINIKISL
jgi:signal transduction histidine kinase